MTGLRNYGDEATNPVPLLPNAHLDSSLVDFVGTTTGEVATNVSAYLNLNTKGLRKNFGAVGDGVADDTTPITKAIASGKIIEAEDGTYAYPTSPNFGVAGFHLYAHPGAIFKHTGSGNAFIIDGGAAGTGIQGMRFDNLNVQGNASSTNGIYARSIQRSTFNNARCLGAAVTGSGILVEFGVLNTWVNPIISSNSGTLSPRPKYGMLLNRRSGTDITTTQTVINPSFEGLTNANGAGLYIDYAGGTTIIGGSSEGNTNGVIRTANGYGLNQFHGLDLEANTSFDLDFDGGTTDSFYGMYCLGNVRFTGSANRNVWFGGRVDTINMGASTAYNTFYGLQVVTTRTDSSVAGLENEWINCTAPGAIVYTNRLRGGTASTWLPQTYSASITINASQQDIALITATNGLDFDITAPTNTSRGQILIITIANASGGVMGAAVFNAVFKTAGAFVKPANGFNRSFMFYYNSTNWIELNRSPADVAN
jgi:hypothetical protein